MGYLSESELKLAGFFFALGLVFLFAARAAGVFFGTVLADFVDA